jgi:hypothetical protein
MDRVDKVCISKQGEKEKGFRYHGRVMQFGRHTVVRTQFFCGFEARVTVGSGDPEYSDINLVGGVALEEE